jgi:hypothetical protein
MQEDASDVVTSVARQFLTAMSVKPGTRNEKDKLWQRIETIVDPEVKDGKQLENFNKPRTTSVLWASAGGALQLLLIGDVSKPRIWCQVDNLMFGTSLWLRA